MKHLLMKVSASFLFLLGTAVLANAQNSGLVEKEYYGVKARDSYKNPCKGETVRICGKGSVMTRLVSHNTLTSICVYEEVERIYDADGNFLREITGQIQIPVTVDPSQYILDRDMQLYDNVKIELKPVSVTDPVSPFGGGNE